MAQGTIRAHAPGEGEIRDLGYRRYEGARLAHRTRYRVLSRYAFSLAWASGLVKADLILGMFPVVVCAVVMFFKIKAQQLLAGQNAPIEIEDPSFWVYYCLFWCQIWFAFAMSLLSAAPAIAEDVRTGAFQFYFARPVAAAHYLWGKLLGAGGLILLVCAPPGILLALVRVALGGSGKASLALLPLVPLALLYAAIITVSLTLPAVALSSVSRRAGYVQGGWAALFFFPWVLGEAMAAATDVPYLVLLSLPTNLRLVGQYLFGVPRSYPLPWYLPAGVLALVVGLSVWFVWRRLRRVEIFA
ncbi:MAG: hypothetical protein IT371_08455 [Deltaproteobacteria bacterium]|nr:hypothetical protein [Deltaproteobacteria bacterium]